MPAGIEPERLLFHIASTLQIHSQTTQDCLQFVKPYFVECPTANSLSEEGTKDRQA